MRRVTEEDIKRLESGKVDVAFERFCKFDKDGNFEWYKFAAVHYAYSAWFYFDNKLNNPVKFVKKQLLEEEFYIYDDRKFSEVLKKQIELKEKAIEDIKDTIDWLKNRKYE